MSGYSTKVFVVQRATGEVIGVKLTMAAAMQLAKAQAPCRVIFALADKTAGPNIGP